MNSAQIPALRRRTRSWGYDPWSSAQAQPLAPCPTRIAIRLQTAYRGAAELQPLPILRTWTAEHAPTVDEVHEVAAECEAMALAVVMTEVDDPLVVRSPLVDRNHVPVRDLHERELLVPNSVVWVRGIGEDDVDPLPPLGSTSHEIAQIPLAIAPMRVIPRHVRHGPREPDVSREAGEHGSKGWGHSDTQFVLNRSKVFFARRWFDDQTRWLKPGGGVILTTTPSGSAKGLLPSARPLAPYRHVHTDIVAPAPAMVLAQASLDG
jgi:hypothetical protein